MTTEKDTDDQKDTQDARVPAVADEGFNLGKILVGIINNVEQLRREFNLIGSEGDERFLDLITARLMQNDAFVMRISDHLIRRAVEARGGKPAPKPQPEEGALQVETIPKSSIIVGAYEFEDSQGFVTVKLDDTGEGVSGGVLHRTGQEPRVLNPNLMFDALMIQAVDRNYRHVTTHEPIMHINPDDKFWFKVEYFHGDPYAPVVRDDVVPEEPTGYSNPETIAEEVQDNG